MRHNVYGNSGYFYEEEPRKRPDRQPQVNEIIMLEVKPKTDHYHYSNPDSQGALVAETADFPFFVDKNVYEVTSAYSDRLQSWDSKHFNSLCALIGGGDQVWTSRLAEANDQRLREIGQFAGTR